MNNIFKWFWLTLHISAIVAAQPVSLKQLKSTPDGIEITLHVSLPDHDYLHKDSIDISIDSPGIALSKWKSNVEAQNQYDARFKENKKIYSHEFTISLVASAPQSLDALDDAYLHISFYQHSKNGFVHQNFPLSQKPALNTTLDTTTSSVHETEKIAPPAPARALPLEKPSLTARLSTLIEQHDALWIRILLALLLGILLSLTPCIYPMIPITVGILHTRSTHSLLHNFANAIIYVAGIATTFALLGVLAAFTGQLFGAIMHNPIVILIIVGVFVYLALSLFGIVHLYIPASLSMPGTTLRPKSLASIFIFGAITGSVASPCLSPGLILMLTIVSSMASPLLGFILLFAFGIGLGLPLIVIGAFSSSIHFLPKSGAWMVDIKTFMGFMLLGSCFYFIDPIVPSTVLYVLFTLFLLGTGIFYLYDSTKIQATAMRRIKSLFGILLIASGIISATYCIKAFTVRTSQNNHVWHTDYHGALTHAKQDNKKLLVNVGSPFCSVCKSIEKTLFNNPAVLACLSQCITCKIDGSDTKNPLCQKLQQQYAIVGFPTVLLINPETQEPLKRWSSELYSTPSDQFIQQLNEHL